MNSKCDLISETLLAARILRPYYGRALSALTPIPVPGLGTVAVDKYWRLYYDPDWLSAQPPQQRANVIAAHEVEHLLRNHETRRITRDPQIWNIAADAEINDDSLVEFPGEPITPKLLGLPEGQLAEQYYDQIVDYQKNKNCRCGSGSGGEKLKCELPDDETIPGIDQDAAERIRDAVASDVLIHKKNNGNVPGGILMWAEDRARKKPVPWPRLAQRVISRIVREWENGKTDYTYRRLSRRWRHGQPLRPGMHKPKLKIALVADTSCSMVENGTAVLSVVQTLTRRHGEITTYACDTKTHGGAKPSRRRKKWIGGGGTNLNPAVAEALTIRPDLLIIVGDGNPWPDRPEKIQPPITISVGIEQLKKMSWANVHIIVPNKK